MLCTFFIAPLQLTKEVNSESKGNLVKLQVVCPNYSIYLSIEILIRHARLIGIDRRHEWRFSLTNWDIGLLYDVRTAYRYVNRESILLDTRLMVKILNISFFSWSLKLWAWYCILNGWLVLSSTIASNNMPGGPRSRNWTSVTSPQNANGHYAHRAAWV
jgi:hypothetical protein